MMTLTAIILFGIFICLILYPYLLSAHRLKNPREIELPLKGKHIKLSKGRIYYRLHEPEIISSDEIIILVHGFSTPSFVWKGLIDDLLSTGRKVLTYDHFGRGFSDRPKQKYSLNFYVETLQELLDNLNLSNNFHIVGYSMGGPISAKFAGLHSKKVKTLNLIAPAGYLSKPHWSMRIILLPLIGDYFFKAFPSVYKNISASETEESDDPKSITKEEFENLFLYQTLFSGFTESLLSTVRNFNMSDSSEAFKKIGQDGTKTQVIWGDTDRVVPISGFEKLKHDVPQVILKEIKNGTHDITYRQPSQVGKYLSKFIIG